MKELRKEFSEWGDSLPNDTLREGKSRLKGFVLIVTGSAALLTFILLLSPGQTRVVGHKYARPPETDIDEGISYDNYVVDQSVLQTSSGSVLLQHYPYVLEKIPDFPVLGGEFAELHFEAGEPWYDGYHNQQVLATFNCHAFAIGSDIGLTPFDLLEALPIDEFPNPLTTVLTEFYRAIASVPASNGMSDAQLIRDGVMPGDVVCLVFQSGTNRQYVHSARVQSVANEIKLLSKMGRQGPVLLTNLKFLLRHYNKTNGLEIYRLKPPVS